MVQVCFLQKKSYIKKKLRISDFRVKYLCEHLEFFFQDLVKNKNNYLILYCKRKSVKPQPFMLCVACLFSAWNFHELLKVFEAPLPHYSYNNIKLHISNFLQRPSSSVSGRSGKKGS